MCFRSDFPFDRGYRVCVIGGKEMELEECIKDAAETAMQEYISTNTYKSQKAAIELSIEELGYELQERQKRRLMKILDDLGYLHGMYALEAYKNGVVEGIALRQKVMHDR